MNANIKIYIIISILFQLYLNSNQQQQQFAIFTSYNESSQLLINNTNLQRFYINSNDCSSTLTTTTIANYSYKPPAVSYISYITTIINNNYFELNAFETKIKYFSTLQLTETFCTNNNNNNNNNTNLTSTKLIVTHTTFDCDDYIITNTILNTNSNLYTGNNIPNQFICLSPSVNQIESVIKSFLKYFGFTYYSIIYSDVNVTRSEDLEYYKKLALSLNYKLSVDSFKLDYLVSINSPLITSKLSSTIAKVVFLLLQCGDEFNFVQMYQNKFPSDIIFISVYDSPQCLPLLNYEKNYLNFKTDTNLQNSYKKLFKLIPIDSTVYNYGTYTIDSIDPSLNNLTSTIDIVNNLNEIESYDMMNSYNYSRITYLNLTNSYVTLFCYKNVASTIETSFEYCQRSFNYYLFNFQKITNNTFQEVIKFTLTPLISSDSIPSANVSITGEIYWANGEVSKEQTVCSTTNIYQQILYFILGIFALCILVSIIALVVRDRIIRKQMTIGPNKILLLPEDLEFVSAKGSLYQSRTNIRQQPNEIKSAASLRSEIDLAASRMAAKYKGDMVFVKRLKIPSFQVKSKTMKELKLIRDLRQENLNPFVGCYTDPKMPALIFEYAPRGSLEDIIMKQEIKLDWNFKWSMLNDLCRGMRYLHRSSIKYHGNLKSRNCVVDSRWVLKITDYGLPSIYTSQSYSRTLDISDLLWTAPEHLRECTIRDQVVISIGSPTGDVYSFAIIMQEVILRGAPFCMMDITHEDIINKVRKPPPLLRPSVSKQAAPPEYINIMRECWSEQPEVRPTFDELCQQFKTLNGGKKVNIVDMMFKMLEQYSNNLEDSIKERTLQLEEEKKKTEKLLAEMLPRTVAESLISGSPVPAESFDCVTIYFSDIVGFTTISAYSSPFEVVQLLNDLYTMFDSTLTDFDVYKVETIGDAYMVVSGLPERNGNKHAGEIATMALTLLHHCGKFKIKHLPGIPLRLRIGIHSGGCVAGVVGLTMPRYCLFGDTVNTASRMESTSMAYRIHVSETAANILREIGGYHLEYRGMTELKGKGKHKTYWLVGKDGFDKTLPDPVDTESNHGFDAELIETLNSIKVNKAQQSNSNADSVITSKATSKETTPENNQYMIDSNNSMNNSMNHSMKISAKASKLNKNDSGFSEMTNSSTNSYLHAGNRGHEQHKNNVFNDTTTTIDSKRTSFSRETLNDIYEQRPRTRANSKTNNNLLINNTNNNNNNNNNINSLINSNNSINSTNSNINSNNNTNNTKNSKVNQRLTDIESIA